MKPRKFGQGIAGVAFDLDGTLIDTLPDLVAAGNRMLQAMGKNLVHADQARNYVGDGIAVLTQRLLAGHRDIATDGEQSPQALDLFKRFYAEELVMRSRPYPGVMEGLRVLHAYLPMACVTNKALAYTEPLLHALELTPYFRLVLGGDSLARKKPDALPFLHCASQWGLRPDQLLVVGDSPNDCKAARAAGCPVVCVPYGYHGPGGLQDLDCDAIVTDLVELAATLLKTDP